MQRTSVTNRFAPYVLYALGLVLVVVTIVGNHGVLHLIGIKNEVSVLDQKNRSLQSETVRVSSEIAATKNSDAHLEKIAREELGLSRRGEIVYIFPSSSSDQ